MPKEITPHDFIAMEKNRQLRIEADWHDIKKQNGDNPPMEGALLLVVCFLFKSQKTMESKDIDFLTRYVLTISNDIVYNNKSSINSIYITKKLSSKNGTRFYFREDIQELKI